MDSSKESFLKLGIICNEFFALSQGRMGGFGRAASLVAECFHDRPELGIKAVFLAGEGYGEPNQPNPIIHNTPLILRQRNKLAYARRIWQEKIDLILSIDYRSNYRSLFWLLPHAPIIVWVRDPHPPEDVVKINTVRIPGQENIEPQGLKSADCTSLAGIVKASKWLKRPVLFATVSPFLKTKIKGTYGVQPQEVTILPNIINLEPTEIRKSAKPTVIFLARLDPYKRPWLFVELARHFPEVDFLVLGKAHFQGKGAWEPLNLPENVKLMGHVGGEEKTKIITSAWVLVNTSIHEGLAISFQEALKCETPLLSCVNPENVVSEFGIYVGRYDGTGMEGIPKFVEGLKILLENHELRIKLGKEGRKWVDKTHNQDNFKTVFSDLCKKVKVY
ncbi:glycosyltransferase family 4 protein [Oscillatoria sp. HE19RPO]|uniref:glycosyltransferase family 4 protein n=1 Tax=Oscillatoria sp. HE19RPO TaxID=2954806 RepID=UPI0020C23903|nr:glycosyltransferase family 4 protein [Oscillatoria sp. HE19RPO]